MVKINPFLKNINNKNSFLEVTRIVNEYKANHKNNKVISIGVGDVSRPIVKTVIDAMHKAVDDLSNIDTFKGYGSYYGYNFLKEKILDNDYKDFDFSLDEIYISNGAKTDSTSILELFDINSSVLITDPMYPIYRDGASALSRNVHVLDSTTESFLPEIPKEKYDIIYICSPNNPTGICYTYDELKKWIDYSLKNKSIIIYDNVYASFISSKDVPKSIYEIDGAKKVAIELRSFSKNASFTGVRCSYYVIPNDIANNINKYWKARTINRFNGADYIAQKGAEAVYTREAQKEINENIKYYKENAKLLREAFEKLNYKVYGGTDSPFLWIKINNGMKSMDYFELFLKEFEIIIIPGIVFGKKGDGYFRVSALAKREVVIEAIERINKYYEK